MVRLSSSSGKRGGGNTVGKYAGFDSKVEMVGVPGSRHMRVKLDPGDEIMTTAGSMLYIRGNVERGEVAIQDASSLFGRMFGGENAFLVRYTGKTAVPPQETEKANAGTNAGAAKNKARSMAGGGFWSMFSGPSASAASKGASSATPSTSTMNASTGINSPGVPPKSTDVKSAGSGGVLALGIAIPGDVLQVALKPGETYTMSRGSYLASTPNVRVSAKLNLIGLIPVGQDEGFVLPTAECAPDQGPGFVWMSAYGTFEEHSLAAGEEMLVDNGLFLACRKDVTYSLAMMGGGVLSSFFGGEGFGMKFTGPCKLYTQSKNMDDFVEYLALRMSRGGGGGGGGGGNMGIVPGAAPLMSEGAGEGEGAGGGEGAEEDGGVQTEETADSSDEVDLAADTEPPPDADSSSNNTSNMGGGGARPSKAASKKAKPKGKAAPSKQRPPQARRGKN